MQIVPFTQDLAPRVKILFPENPPIPTRLWAILDGTIRGRILVDEPTRPAFALIQDLTEGTAHLGGAITPPAVREAFAIVRPYQDVVVCLWPDSPLVSLLPEEPYYEGVAIDFTDRSPSVNLDRLAALPPGYQMRRIDTEIAQAIEGFDYYVTMYGDLERAVQNTVGYRLMRGDTMACEAVAGPLIRGVAEMGVETAVDHRHKGLATVTAAYVIRECEALGYRPFWNAAQQNLASVALARRLGFQTEQPFTVLAWPAVK